MDINLGDRAKDKISGITGIVTCTTVYLAGSARAAITPEESKDGKPAESCDFDLGQLTVVQKNVVEPTDAGDQVIQLGDRVSDQVSGYVGIVECVTTWLYGCRRFGVRAEGLFEGQPIHRQYFDEPELKMVKKAVLASIAVKAPEPVVERRPPGGPRRETAGFRR
jgi:hypothetical protein